MARITIASLRNIIDIQAAELDEAKLVALQALAKVEDLERQLATRAAPVGASNWRKNAAVTYVDGKPFWTAFTHSAAYRVMRKAREAGHTAMYKPLH
jgi:hypothetical protein